MPITDHELKSHYQDFLEDSGEEFATERLEKKNEVPELLAEDKVEQFEEGDIREIVRNLWAFEGWSNKDYIVNQILEDGIDHVRDVLHQALYETKDVGEKFDLMNEKVNMLGPASITEILTFMYPGRCAIFNRRARDAFEVLGYGDRVPSDIDDGEKYKQYLDVVSEVKNRLEEVDDAGEIQDLVDVDYFLFYLSKLETGEEAGTGGEEPVEDFDHDKMQDKLLEIGDGLGFDVEDEYQAGPGARIDVRWSTRVANLGVISYAFEVHRRGSRDSAILNLQKAQAADPTLQKLVIVSTEDELERFQDEIDAISTDFAKTVSYLRVGQVNQAVDLLADLKEILQEADLMGDL